MSSAPYFQPGFSPFFNLCQARLNQPSCLGGYTPFLQQVINNELLGFGEFVEPYLQRTLALLGIRKRLSALVANRRTQQGIYDEQSGLDAAVEGFLQQILELWGIPLAGIFMPLDGCEDHQSSYSTLKLNKKLKF